ncbi:unnamed protein product [Adineta ricciae]|uniref:G-protein coupled receptors family 1 profile domain-containing protein n=1 Tax=Adineta ricciae TaxID=249248 RepID=A0A814XYG4_ADIRI|nr:unnamed protein product [Adineta ricciae]CAF1222502.1 unnamed protein product [Adineta ricciae]
MNNFNETNSLGMASISTASFRRTLKQFGVIYMAAVIILGFIGNSISSYVFIRSKLKRLSCSSYLIALSLSDNGYLICLSLVWLENLRVYIFHNNGICQIAVYLTTVFSSLSVWFTVAFTTERFVVVAYPLKRSQYNSATRSRYVILLLTFLAILLYSSSLWTSGIEIAETQRSTSSARESRCVTLRPWVKFTRQMNIIDFFLTFIIPFFTILTLNTLIILKSGHYDRLLERNYIQPSTYVLHNLLEHRLRRSKYHRRITKMLLIISTTFLLLNTPMHLLKIYYFFFSNDDSYDEKNSIESMIEMLTFYLFYTNFSINFFLYSLCGKNFRSSLMESIKHIGKNTSSASFFSNAGDNPFGQYYQRSQRFHPHSRFEKRELSSTLSNGNGFMSTSNIAATMATGISQQTLHPSSSASSFKRNSLKIELQTPAAVKFYSALTMK